MDSETSEPSHHSATYDRLSPSLEQLYCYSNRKKYPLPKESNEHFEKILNIVVKDKDNCKVDREKEFEIVKSLKKSYDAQIEFNLDLFHALSKDLEAIGIGVHEVLMENELKYIILPYEFGKYRCGFARQMKGAYRVPGKTKNLARASATFESGVDKSYYGHCCCLFEKIENGKNVEWEVRGILSVVVLKMSNTSSESGFHRLLDDVVNIQPISHVLESVWPSLCRFSLGNEVESLTIALIAAKKQKKDPPPEETKIRNRWVKGNLIIPTTWPNKFSLFQSGSQPFENDDSGGDQSNEDGSKKAANLYTETILEGLKLCQRLFQKCRDKDVGSPFDLYPTPLSGPPLSDLKKSAEFVASPLLTSKEVEKFQKSPPDPKLYDISQGEIFFFKKLDLEKMNKLNPKMHGVFWLISDEIVEDVLVKVWWKGIHRHLQDAYRYEHAFSWLHDNVVQNRRNRDSQEMDKLKKSLSEVCLGVIFKSSLISFTVMRKIQGQPVKLEENKSLMIEYWDCFKALCKDILLPLADMGIMYQDLRPGFDCTYNVLLVDDKEDKSDKEKKKMVLIDYESLVLMDEYNFPRDERYPKKFEFENRAESMISLDFLFQQCIGIANSWIEYKKSDEFKFNDALIWWSKEMKLNVSISTDDNLSEIERKRKEVQSARESSLEWWKQKLPNSESEDPEAAEAAFDKLFHELDKFIKKAHHETTKVTPPHAKSHTVTAEADKTKDMKRQKTS